MTLVPKWLLRLAGADGRRHVRRARASRAEELDALHAHLHADEARFADAMRGRDPRSTILIGETLDRTPYRVPAEAFEGASTWCTASTGAGKTRFAAHVVMELLRASRARHGVEVTRFLADHDLRRVDGSVAYIPDALVEIEEEGAGAVRLVLEVDLGAERAAQFAPKVETTVGLARAGRAVWGLPVPWRPVVLAPSVARLRSLAATIVRGGGGELWIAGLLDRVTADPFGAVFTTAALIEKTPTGTELAFQGRLVRPETT